jgi:hypothetical protein
LIVLPACKQILGLHERSEYVATSDAGPDAETPDTGPPPARGQCGQVMHPSQACADCMDQSCCDELTACKGDPACELEFDCQFKCGDNGACRARCNQFYNRGEPIIAVGACRERSCSAECGLSCGGFAYAVPGCDDCVRSNCCAAAKACAANDNCQKLDLCRSNCLPGSTNCPPSCDSQFASGQSDYGPWFNCVQNTCAMACAPGKGWQCLDTSNSWPRPSSIDDFTFSVTIVDLLSENPYVGATVKACPQVDFTCARPIDQGTTDSTGLVSLTVSSGLVGFNGYLEITGGDNGTGMGEGSQIFPALYYPVPPIVSPGWRGRLQFVSAGDLPVLAVFTTVQIDPMRGHFAANAVDCNFSAAGGISFTASAIEINPNDTEIKTFYFVSNQPTIRATETDPLNPIAGFVNLPPGSNLITATYVTDAGAKKVASVNYNIRAGWFATSSFPPAAR